MSDITRLTEKITADAEKKYQLVLNDAQVEIEKQERLKRSQLEEQLSDRLAQFEKENGQKCICRFPIFTFSLAIKCLPRNNPFWKNCLVRHLSA